jgi:hypothetical protein
MLRTLPPVLILAVAGWIWQQVELRAAADNIVDGLNVDKQKGSAAVISLWRSDATLRERVAMRLLNSPDRLRDVGTAWVAAYVSIEFDAAAKLAKVPIVRLDRPGVDRATQQSLLSVLGVVGGRLDPTAADNHAKDLIARLDRPGVDRATQQSLLSVLGVVGGRLDPTAADNHAKHLRASLDRAGGDRATQQSLHSVLGVVGRWFDPTAADNHAKYLRASLDWP